MKKLLFAVASLCFAVSFNMSAQSVAEIMRDKDKYVYVIGEGSTIAEADEDAMNQFANMSSMVIKSTHQVVSDEYEAVKEVRNEISNMYLDGVKREVLPKADGKFRVLKYMLRADWDERYNACKGQIENYIASGAEMSDASGLGEALRYYSWAYILLQAYPKNDISIENSKLGAKQYVASSVSALLRDITISVIGIDEDKTKTNYPYQLYLDFTYKGEPIEFMEFSYFDGSGFCEGATVKDGRSTVDMKNLPETFALQVECLYKDLARTLDPNVYALMQNPSCASSFDGSLINVNTKPKGVKVKKSFDSSSPRVNSVVEANLKESVANHVPVLSTLRSTDAYVKVMNKITEGISSGNMSSLRGYFTEQGWKDFNAIVSNGSPKLVRTPKFRFLQLDTIVMCRSIPLKLKFSGNRGFIEDVAFRFSSVSGKIISLAYTLSSNSEELLMAMEWEDKARLLLLNFLEDYRTAYCLKNADYVEKVFSDDAYIIVGRVLKASTVKTSSKDEVAVQLGKDAVVYQTLSKRDYVRKLRNSFASKEFVNIRFEEFTAAKGYYSKEGIYAVQVRQHYYSDNYADDGYLTLAVDLRNQTLPVVKVRVWQQHKDKAYTAEEMIERTVSTASGIY